MSRHPDPARTVLCLSALWALLVCTSDAAAQSPQNARFRPVNGKLTQGIHYWQRNAQTGEFEELTDLPAIRRLTSMTDPPTTGDNGPEDRYQIFLDQTKTYQLQVIGDGSFPLRPGLAYGYGASDRLRVAYRDTAFDANSANDKNKAEIKDFKPGKTDYQWLIVYNALRQNNAGTYQFNFTDYWTPGTVEQPGTYGGEASGLLLGSGASVQRADGKPNSLFLNFDGFTGNDPAKGEPTRTISPLNDLNKTLSAAERDKWIQYILFKTSERFAPFNLIVTRKTGNGQYSSYAGDSTVFIGDDSDKTKDGKNLSGAWGESPLGYDFGNKKADLGWVDPLSGKDGLTKWDGIVDSICHETGHNFGLVHIRTVGSDDPLPGSTELTPLVKSGSPQAARATPEVMSYDSPNTIFRNKSFPATVWNYAGDDADGNATYGKLTLPKWRGEVVKTQNSYRCLTVLFGRRVWDDLASVADFTAYDYDRANQKGSWLDRPIQDAAKGTYSIERLGDYDVLQVGAAANQLVTCRPAVGSMLDPILMVFSDDGKNLLAYDNNSGGGAVAQVRLPRGGKVKIVVGAKDCQSQGQYTLDF